MATAIDLPGVRNNIKTEPIINAVPSLKNNAPVVIKQPTSNINNVTPPATPSKVGRGSSSNNSRGGFSSANPMLNTNPEFPISKPIEFKEEAGKPIQSQQLTLARQNVLNEAEARQRENNFIYKTRPDNSNGVPKSISKSPNLGGTVYGENTGYEWISAFKQSFKNIIGGGKGGANTLSEYRESVTAPFGEVLPSMKFLTNPKQTGTIINNDVTKTPTGPLIKDYTNLTPGEFKVIMEQSRGVRSDLVGLPTEVKQERLQSEVQKNIQAQYNREVQPQLEGLSKEDQDKLQNELLPKYQEKAQEQYKNTVSTVGQFYDTDNKKGFSQAPKVIADIAVDTALIAGFETAFPLETAMVKDIATLRTSKNVGEYFKSNSRTVQLEVNERLKELKNTNFAKQNLGKEVFTNEKGSSFKINVEKVTADKGAKQTIGFNINEFNINKPDVIANSESGIPTVTEKGSQSISGHINKGKVETTIYSDFSNKKFTSVETFKGGTNIGNFGNKATYYKNNIGMQLQEVNTGIGSGYLNVGGNIKPFKVLGVSKETNEGYNVASGIPKQLNLGYSKSNVKGNFNIIGDIEKVKPKDLGLTFEYDNSFKPNPKLDMGLSTNNKPLDFGLVLEQKPITKQKGLSIPSTIEKASKIEPKFNIGLKQSQELKPKSITKSNFFQGTNSLQSESYKFKEFQIPKLEYKEATIEKITPIQNTITIDKTIGKNKDIVVQGLGDIQGEKTPNDLKNIYPTFPPITNPKGKFDFGFDKLKPLDFSLPSLGGGDIGLKKKKKVKSFYNITPSFTAIAENITSKKQIKISKKYGVLPNQIRPIVLPKPKKQKRKKQTPYFKFLDVDF